MKSLIVVFILILHPACYGFPYNERDAFCRDKLSRYNSNYTNAKIYNHCISNADRLIKEYEKEKARRRIEWERGEPERKRQREQMEKERKQQQLQEAREQKKWEEEQYKKKLEEQIEKQRINNLFETKFR